MAMEEEFEVEIPDEEAENIKTVQDAVNYITTHKEAARPRTPGRECPGRRFAIYSR